MQFFKADHIKIEFTELILQSYGGIHEADPLLT